MTGRLEIVTGPMFSGKTTELIRRLCINSLSGLNAVYVNSHKDTRDDHLSTHNEAYSEPPKMLRYMKTDSLEQCFETLLKYDVIGIDESQFFTKLTNIVSRLVDCKKTVIVAGLSSDAQRKPFGEILQLVPNCDDFVMLKAVCKFCCKETKGKVVDAPFTRKISGTDSVIDVGGGDKYVAVCRRHMEDAILN